MTILSVSDVSVEFAGAPIFERVTFTVAQGDRWGIIGRNGSGKTTLFHVLAGTLEPTRGTVARVPGMSVSLMDQHRDFDGALTVWDAAAGPLAEILALEGSLAEQANAMGAAGDAVTPEQLDRYSHDFERFEHAGGYTLGPRVDAVLSGLGFDPVEARERTLASLSGGERGRIGLARQLVAPADLLLLDEPTNHLDLDTTRWLEGWLQEQPGTLLVVSHDRAFLSSVVNHVLHVEQGTMVPYEAGYDAFVHQRTERRMAQARAFTKQQKQLAATEDFIARNIAGQKSSQAKGRRRRLERVERLSAPPGEAGAMTLRLESSERGGDQVLVCEQVRLAMGERTLLERFSGRVGRGEVLALIGPNGAGKSTLLHTITGERPPEGGSVRISPSITVGYYRQDLSQLDPAETIYDAIHDRRPMWTRGQIQGHLGRFDFSGDTVLRRIGSLSGGERARVALALLELEKANFLIFDEPTNHLDVETIEALEDAIADYEGTVVVVSHDRALLRALTTRVWAYEGTRLVEFPGPFEEWEAVRADAARAAATKPARDAAAKDRKPTKGAEQQQSRKAQQNADRVAKRELEAAESAVANGEADVQRLEAELARDDLYTRPGGTARAAELADALAAARKQLDAAIARWEAAMAASDVE